MGYKNEKEINGTILIVGEYELQEVIDDTETITAKEWNESRGSDEYMTINSNNTLTKISSYGKYI